MSQQQNRSRGRMVIELTRTVPVHIYNIVGEVGFAQRRDELRAVMQLGVEQGGELTAQQLCQRLLAGKPDVVGLRLLTVCERLGLVEWTTKTPRRDSGARLTDAGREVAEGGDVFVPERGTWTIWVAEDPLVPEVERLLRLESFREPTAYDEMYGKKDKDKSPQQRETVELPKWVQEACNVYGKLAWGDGRAISMNELEPRAEPGGTDQLTLTLRVAPGEVPTVHLRGALQGQQREYELPEAPAPDFEETWRYCLGSKARDWDGSRLAVPFNVLDDEERASFERNIGFERWSHPTHGSFGRFGVPHVPLRPASDLDASLWANWLLAYQTQSYVRRADYDSHCEQVRRTFTGYRLQLMTQEQLATSLRKTSGERPSRKYWYQQAPLDWAL